MIIRPATTGDAPAIWAILEPVIRTGETYTLDRDMDEEAALAYWFGSDKQVFVAEDGGAISGTYYLRTNQAGGGGHVCNCGYVTASAAVGRGVARAMALHSMQYAKASGFRAMQYNFVVASNERAVQLWRSLGFEIVGQLPDAFDHPVHGYVDAFVMFRML